MAPRRCSKSSDFVPRFAASLLAPARSHLNQWAFAPASVPYHLPTHLLLLLYHSHASASSPGCMIEVLAPHWRPWAPSIIHYPPPSPLWPLLASLTTSFFPAACLTAEIELSKDPYNRMGGRFHTRVTPPQAFCKKLKAPTEPCILAPERSSTASSFFNHCYKKLINKLTNKHTQETTCVLYAFHYF